MKITINDPHAVESAGSKKPDFMLSNKVCALNIFEILLQGYPTKTFIFLYGGSTCQYMVPYMIIFFC
jgi:hypothetical protein